MCKEIITLYLVQLYISEAYVTLFFLFKVCVGGVNYKKVATLNTHLMKIK